MKKTKSTKVKKPTSSKPGKQRKWQANAPLHKKRSFCKVMLSPELKKKYNCNSIQVHKGDTVKVLRGSSKGVTGNVLRVDVKDSKIYVDGLTIKKADGTEVERQIHPSNLQITSIVLEDRKRKKVLERKAGG